MRAFISRCRALGRDMSLEFLNGMFQGYKWRTEHRLILSLSQWRTSSMQTSAGHSIVSQVVSASSSSDSSAVALLMQGAIILLYVLEYNTTLYKSTYSISRLRLALCLSTIAVLKVQWRRSSAPPTRLRMCISCLLGKEGNF